MESDIRKHKKKILIVQHYAGMGGSTLSCMDIIKALKDVAKISVILPAGSSDAKKMAIAYGAEVLDSPQCPNFTYHSASSGVLKTGVKYLGSKRYLPVWKQLMKTYSPDLVILNSSVQAPLIPMLHSLNIPCMCYVRETMRGKAWWPATRFLRGLVRKADAVAFLTEYDRNTWSINSQKRMDIIPDVVDSSYFMEETESEAEFRQRNHIETEGFHILYLGGFSSIKGVHRITEAMQFLKEYPCILHILGDDGEKMRSLSGIKRWMYRDEVQCIHHVDQLINEMNANTTRIMSHGVQKNITHWFRIADVVVFPVEKVHQARPVYEAGFHCKSVIVPDYDNFKNNVRDGYNGLLYRRHDSKDLAEKIKALVNNPEWNQSLGEQNYDLSHMNHTEEILKERMCIMICELL